MLSAEADILAFDLDSMRLLRGYREAGLTARADRAKAAAVAAKAAEEAKAAAEAEAAANELQDEPAEAASLDVVDPPAEDMPEAASSGKPERDKGDPWVDRIAELEFVEPERLSELHGKLIAAGFLNFQIRNRHSGIEYRITNAGKQFLTRAVEEGNDLADLHEPNAESPPELVPAEDAGNVAEGDTEPDVIAMSHAEQTEAA